MMKIISVVIFLMLLTIASSAQTVRGSDAKLKLLPGAVHGEIVIKEVSGNHLGNFSCANLTAHASKLSGGWTRKATATGSFAARRCSFRIANVPAGEPFVATLTANFPNACDEKKFEPTTSFPMELKGREQMRYSFSVNRIRCVLVK